MKEFWVLLDELGDKIPEIADNLARADVVLSHRMQKREVERLLGRKVTVASPAEDSDIQLVLNPASLSAKKPSAIVVDITSGSDEQKVTDACDSGASYVILRCHDWKVIPLENIISNKKGDAKILMEISDHNQARLALQTLELGSDGVVLRSSSPEEVLKASQEVQGSIPELDLVEVEVTRKKEIGLGARACVDTTDLMRPGEGLLVGCQSNALFLVQAEVDDNPYIASRPFRVNAGPVSLYVLSAQEKTNYLSELEAGHPVLVVNREGKTRPGCVGRIKIERRPMILIEAKWKGKLMKTILQNAETIRLVTRDGSRSVAELAPGNLVLARVEQGGRHYGTLVAAESIIEK